jgi:hypothetical protein
MVVINLFLHAVAALIGNGKHRGELHMRNNHKSAGAHRGGMKKTKALFSCLLLAASTQFLPVTASGEGVVHVTGANNAAVDRQAIQAAIDSAPGKKAKVELHGTFQLDGGTIVIDRSNLTLQGGPDGATLLGVLDVFGRPDGGANGQCNLSNRGVEIRGPDPIENIVIKDLTIIGHCRSVSMIGTSSQTPSENTVTNVVVKNNQMQNNLRGPQIFGATADIVVKDNLITDAHEIGILVQSDADGALSGAILKNNVSATSGVLRTSLPIQIAGPNNDVLIRGNTFQGGIAAVGLFGVATNVVVTENWILDGGTQAFRGFSLGGVLVGFSESPADGYVVKNNVYQNNVASEPLFTPTLVPRDVWLWSNSSNNVVTAVQDTAVFDQGISNTVTLIP